MDTAPRIGWDQRRVTELLNDVPEQFRDDVRAWVAALRGEGIRRSPPLRWVSVRNYVNFAHPTLCHWGARCASLREITPDDIKEAIYARTGGSRGQVQTALRSLFRGLKRERRNFANPAAGVSVRLVPRAPRPLPSDRLRGLLQRLDTPRDQLITALVAVHALGISDMRGLQVDDLDRRRGTLRVVRQGREFLVVLDELVLQMVTDWLRVRATRWPATNNPYLLISGHTAQTRGPMSRFGLEASFRRLDITPNQLRTDRILDEARHTADPVQLIRVFGLGTTPPRSGTSERRTPNCSPRIPPVRKPLCSIRACVHPR
jgi:integrase